MKYGALIALLLGFATMAFAQTGDGSRSATARSMPGGLVGLTSPTNKTIATVGTDGALHVADRAFRSVKQMDGTDGYAIEEPALLSSIVFSAATAGNWAAIYDGHVAAANLILDVTIAANNGTTQLNFPGGIYIENDVYVDFTVGGSTTSSLSIVYETL